MFLLHHIHDDVAAEEWETIQQYLVDVAEKRQAQLEAPFKHDQKLVFAIVKAAELCAPAMDLIICQWTVCSTRVFVDIRNPCSLPEVGRVTPYAVYDVGANAGWVSVGIDRDTAAFAVASIRRWWQKVGQARYRQGSRLLITANGGGSNGPRVRLWNLELQSLADETGLTLTVCHFPPGTSKWNKIEHRLFSFITQNWRGKPLVSYGVILSLIAATTTATGLTVESVLDSAPYPAGRKVTDEEMATIQIQRDAFHGEWNYTISPRVTSSETIIV